VPSRSTVPLPVVDTGPEALFRIGTVRVEGTHVRGSMRVGPWSRAADNHILAGSLGVLVDNVLGYAIIAARPPDHWSVSTEITLEVFPALSVATGQLHAEARVVHTDATGGYATGRVLDDDGRLLAVCSQRGRFVPADASSLSSAVPDLAVPEAADIADLLGLGPVATRGIDLDVSPMLQNPMRNLHGGITLCVADLLAATTLAATDDPPLATASIHATYARPIPAEAPTAFRAVVVHRGRSLAVVNVTAAVGSRACVMVRIVAQQLPRPTVRS
jgi:acyl-coenzyme A thioesterase PaaI-like protein